MLTSATQTHVFAADSAPNTPTPTVGVNNGYYFPGAGTLSFVSGNQLVTLTDFYFATPSVYNLDLTGPLYAGPDGILDYVGGITFTVTSVPEPRLAIWALVCFSGLFLVRKTRAALKY